MCRVLKCEDSESKFRDVECSREVAAAFCTRVTFVHCRHECVHCNNFEVDLVKSQFTEKPIFAARTETCRAI